ncbi:MAG: DUF3179 domain-containing protein [Acidimicrobiales bacterium]
MSRPFAVVIAIALLAAGCSTSDPTASVGEGESVDVVQLASSPRESGPSALQNPNDPAFPAPLVDPDDIRSGGVPPDGIAPIDKPAFVRVGSFDWLGDNEPVLALTIGDETRAYPVQIMTWHEIVNDTVGGVPVSITYCPLCNSAVAYDRRLPDGRVVDFGTSGSLYRSALVMYDRQTESLWTHYLGQAVVGRLAGTTLAGFPMATVSYMEFREAHPDGLVLSRKTGFTRSYGTNPYPGYDDINTSPFLFSGKVDGRLTAKARVVGMRDGSSAVAVDREQLAKSGVVDVKVGQQAVTVWHKPGTVSSLDQSEIAASADIGAVAAYGRTLADRLLTFRRVSTSDGIGFVDAETGSRWNLLGQATSGALVGKQLDAVTHVDTFWFAWAAYSPQSRVEP